MSRKLRRYGRTKWPAWFGLWSLTNVVLDSLQTLESEEVDLNANLHGNWTLENAKARLNQFFQKEKTSAEYKYSQVGPDHNRSGSENPFGFTLITNAHIQHRSRVS